ncbi:MAG: hypothetical protein JPMHGGIA_01559 [Saprospiraceae bacterium]|nr:hypothetical protein [Saprospiraceae bacterium]
MSRTTHCRQSPPKPTHKAQVGGDCGSATDVAPFGATSDRRIACADVALNGSHLRICEISPRIAASLLPLRNLANPAIRYLQA